MAHLERDKRKLIHRVRRIRGQLNAVERDLEQDADCSETLRMIAACRGAMNGLMQQVLEGHVRHHVVDPRRKPTPDQERAMKELLEVIKAYLK